MIPGSSSIPFFGVAKAASPCILHPALCNTTGIPPIAIAGPNQTIYRTARDPQPTVTLDGSQSYDPEGHSLTYKWALLGSDYSLGGTGIYPGQRLQKPGHFIGADTATPSFVAGYPVGVFDYYTYGLTVNNGKFDSTNDARVTVTLVSVGASSSGSGPNPPRCILAETVGRGGGCGPGLP